MPLRSPVAKARTTAARSRGRPRAIAWCSSPRSRSIRSLRPPRSARRRTTQRSGEAAEAPSATPLMRAMRRKDGPPGKDASSGTLTRANTRMRSPASPQPSPVRTRSETRPRAERVTAPTAVAVPTTSSRSRSPAGKRSGAAITKPSRIRGARGLAPRAREMSSSGSPRWPAATHPAAAKTRRVKARARGRRRQAPHAAAAARSPTSRAPPGPERPPSRLPQAAIPAAKAPETHASGRATSGAPGGGPGSGMGGCTAAERMPSGRSDPSPNVTSTSENHYTSQPQRNPAGRLEVPPRTDFLHLGEAPRPGAGHPLGAAVGVDRSVMP